MTLRGGWVFTGALVAGRYRNSLGPNQVLVGQVACLGHGGGRHTTWHCHACEAVVYGPPLAKNCTALAGPAAVRLSNFIPLGHRLGGLVIHRPSVGPISATPCSTVLRINACGQLIGQNRQAAFQASPLATHVGAAPSPAR